MSSEPQKLAYFRRSLSLLHVCASVQNFTFPAIKSILQSSSTSTNTSSSIIERTSGEFNLMETTTTTTTEKQVMVVAIDDREHTLYALQWTLDHFFTPFDPNPPYKLVLVHAKPTPSSVIGFIGPGGGGDVLPIIESDLKKIAAATIEKAKEICTSKSVNDVGVEVVEGDARNVICDVVEKYHATILVVGSHGYGVIKRAVLGSVSDYCAHHAHCTVMIVKKPKIKH